MDNRKLIYFLLLVGIIVLFLTSVSVDVSYSDTKNRRQGPVVQDDMNSNPLYVNDMNEVETPNTVYAKIVSRPDVSVHKKLLEAENKFYSNRCEL